MNIRQLFVDARQCVGDLNNPTELIEHIRRGIEFVKATEMNCCEARFVPHGVTIAVILGESHIVVSTWPEFNFATVDILLCNDDMDPLVVWDKIAGCLKPKEEQQQWIIRKMPGVYAASIT